MAVSAVSEVCAGEGIGDIGTPQRRRRGGSGGSSEGTSREETNGLGHGGLEQTTVWRVCQSVAWESVSKTEE